MAEHEIGNVLHKYTKQSVQITDVRIGLICSVCGHHWGVALDDNGDLLLQAQKMMCLPCYHNDIKGNDGDDDNGYKRNTQK